MENVAVRKVEKERLQEIQFFNVEPHSKKEKNQLHKSLHLGMLLGNIYRNKVKIYFESAEGQKMVETTIWAVTDKNVVLKGGVIIPITALHKVDLF